MTRLPRLLAVCGVVALVSTSSTTSLAAVANVSLENISFVPATLEIHVGDSVVWTHNDNVQQHTVTAAPGQDESFDFPAGCGPLAGSCMEQGEIFTHRFDTAGTFEYFCNVHCRDGDCPAGGMRGQVVVNPAPDPTPIPDEELDPVIEEPEAPAPTPPPPAATPPVP
jgi:plastocyanin